MSSVYASEQIYRRLIIDPAPTDSTPKAIGPKAKGQEPYGASQNVRRPSGRSVCLGTDKAAGRIFGGPPETLRQCMSARGLRDHVSFTCDHSELTGLFFPAMPPVPN